MENNNYEEFKSRRLAELAKLPLHKDYKQIEGMLIPLGDVLTIKECSQEEYKTKGGIIMAPGENLEHCRIGYVINKGELCQLPVLEGQTVAFDRSCIHGFHYEGENYLRVPSFMVHFVVPPRTYLEPHYADFFEKRRESRVKGEKNVRKREDERLEQSFDDRDSKNKKADYIEGKNKNNTIIK